MSENILKPYKHFGRNVKVEWDLFNYATKADLKRGVNTSNLVAKLDLAILQSQVDEIDIDELKTVPADLSKLSYVVDNDVATKAVYNKLVTKVNTIDTSRLALKMQYITDKPRLEKIIDDANKKKPDASGHVKKTDYNVKIIEIVGKHLILLV